MPHDEVLKYISLVTASLEFVSLIERTIESTFQRKIPRRVQIMKLNDQVQYYPGILEL